MKTPYSVKKLLYQATPLVTVPGTNGSNFSDSSNPGDLAQMLIIAFRVALSVGAVLAVLQIARAGFMYMFQGMDVFDKKTQAKQIFQDAIFGLLLLYGTYLIFNQINPQILDLSAFSNSTPSGGNGGGLMQAY